MGKLNVGSGCFGKSNASNKVNVLCIKGFVEKIRPNLQGIILIANNYFRGEHI